MIIRFSNRLINSLVISGALLLGFIVYYFVVYPSFASVNAYLEVDDMRHEYTTGESAFVPCVLLNTGHRPSYFLVLANLISTDASTLLPDKVYHLKPGQKQRFYYELKFSSAMPAGNYILHVRLRSRGHGKPAQSLASVKRVFRIIPRLRGRGASPKKTATPAPQPSVRTSQPVQDSPVTWVNIPSHNTPSNALLQKMHAYFSSPAKARNKGVRRSVARLGVRYVESVKIISSSFIPAPATRPVVRDVIPKRRWNIRERIALRSRRFAASLRSVVNDIIPSAPDDLALRRMPLKPSTLKKMVSTESRVFFTSLKNGIISLLPDKGGTGDPSALPNLLPPVPAAKPLSVPPVTLSFPATTVPAAGTSLVPVFGPGARRHVEQDAGTGGLRASLIPAPKTPFPYVRAPEPKTVTPEKTAPAPVIKTVKQPDLKPAERPVPVKTAAVAPEVKAPAVKAAVVKPVPAPEVRPQPQQAKKKAAEPVIASAPAPAAKPPAPAPKPEVKPRQKTSSAQPALTLEPVVPAARTIDVKPAPAVPPAQAKKKKAAEAVQPKAKAAPAVEASASSAPVTAAAPVAETRPQKEEKKKTAEAVIVNVPAAQAPEIVQPKQEAVPAAAAAAQAPVAPVPEIRLSKPGKKKTRTVALDAADPIVDLESRLTAYERFYQGYAAVQETAQEVKKPQSPEEAVTAVQSTAAPVMPRIAGVPVAKITIEQKAPAQDKTVAVLPPSRVKKIQESSQTVGKIRDVSLPNSFERGTTSYIDVTVENVSEFEGYFTIVVNINKSTSTVASLNHDLKLAANEKRMTHIPYLVPRVRVSGTYSVAVDLVVRRTVDHSSGKKLQYTLFDKPPLITFLRMEPVKQGELMVDFLANVASDVDVKEVFFMYYPKSEKKEKYFPMQLVSGDRTNGVWSYKLPIPMQTRKPCFAFVAIDENEQKTKTPELTLAGD